MRHTGQATVVRKSHHAREIGHHAAPFTRCQPSPFISGHPSPLECHPSPSSPGHPSTIAIEHNHYSSSSWSRTSCNTLHSSTITSNSSPCNRQDAHQTRATGDQQLGGQLPSLEEAIITLHHSVPSSRPVASIVSHRDHTMPDQSTNHIPFFIHHQHRESKNHHHQQETS